MAGHDNVIPFPGSGTPSDPDETRKPIQDFIEQAGGPIGAMEALHQWMGAGMGAGLGAEFDVPRVKPTLLARRPERVAYTVRLDLDDAKPPIWRRLRLASDLTLDRLHAIIQVAMGWTDSHLHQFQAGPDHRDFQMQPFLTAYDIQEGDEGIPEADVRLDEAVGQVGHRLFYEYDFGDGWRHTVKLEKVEPWRDEDPVAQCLTGRRACPPEDVGGLPGYEEVLEALAGRPVDGGAESLDQILEWLPPGFDPEAFDANEVNGMLSAIPLPDLTHWHEGIAQLFLQAGGSTFSPVAELVSRATAERVELTPEETADAAAQYIAFLRAVGDGLTLTQAGYLPPRVVEALFDELDFANEWLRRGTREDQTLPVATLRASATALGLVRKARGRLTVTAAGMKCATDPQALLRHVGKRLPLGRHDSEKDAGLLALLRAAAGHKVLWDDEEFGGLFADVGWFDRAGRQAAAAFHSARPTLDVLEHLAGRNADAESLARIANALLQRDAGGARAGN